MNALWAASAQAIREVLSLATEREGVAVMPRAVGVAGHGDGVFLLDESGVPLGLAVTSLDSRAQATISAWEQDGTLEQALKVTGQIPFQSSPAPLLAHRKQHDKERFQKIGSILSCKDWLRYCLTGHVATDFGEASASFTDVRTQQYSKAALELYGLQDLEVAQLEILLPDAIAGQVTDEAAELTGLAQGTPVVAGLHDVSACAVGAGIVRTGAIAIVAGTYSINEILTRGC